jgi:hypothetical protein
VTKKEVAHHPSHLPLSNQSRYPVVQSVPPRVVQPVTLYRCPIRPPISLSNQSLHIVVQSVPPPVVQSVAPLVVQSVALSVFHSVPTPVVQSVPTTTRYKEPLILIIRRHLTQTLLNLSGRMPVWRIATIIHCNQENKVWNPRASIIYSFTA